MDLEYSKQILAIYGAIISTIALSISLILLFLRFRDRSDKKQKLLVKIDHHTELNKNQYNYLNGRKGDQFLRIRITNKSHNANHIEKVELFSTDKFWKFNFRLKKVELNFDHDFDLPAKLEYSQQENGLIYLNMNSSEFDQSKESNYKTLQKLKTNYLLVKVYDTQGKIYTSNKIQISNLLEAFLKEEKLIVIESYWQEKYN